MSSSQHLVTEEEDDWEKIELNLEALTVVSIDV